MVVQNKQPKKEKTKKKQSEKSNFLSSSKNKASKREKKKIILYKNNDNSNENNNDNNNNSNINNRMWSPTHIKVTIRSARGLLVKGKNNTNNCFVTIALGKERYQTSIKDKAEASVTWNEECELKIPDQGNRAELILTCLHRNNLGLDEFLGQITLPLNEMDVYERPRPRWFKLESKPGKEKKNKERGELDVLVSFTVKSGSLTDLSKKEKNKSSIGQLASSVGGSLLSIGTLEKRKGIKKFAKSLGSKMHLNGGKHKKPKDGDDMSYTGSFASIGTPNRRTVIDSEDEDDFHFDNLSQKSSVSSVSVRDSPRSGIRQNLNVKNASPLIGSGGKGFAIGGKEQQLQQLQSKTFRNNGFDNLSVDPEAEQIDNDFSIRARTLPPPSKPPRIQQLTDIVESDQKVNTPSTLDEWEEKLYGRHTDVNGSDSLKRRIWEPACVPLPAAKNDLTESAITNNLTKHTESEVYKEIVEKREESKDEKNSENKEEEKEEEQGCLKDETKGKVINENGIINLNSSSSSDEFEDGSLETLQNKETNHDSSLETDMEISLKVPSDIEIPNNMDIRKDSLISPECQRNEFNKFNASFAEFEQRHGDKIYDMETETKSVSLAQLPQMKTEPNVTMDKSDKNIEEKSGNLKDELKSALTEDDLNRREAKRREEDQRILNFAKRLTSPIVEKPEINKPLKEIDESLKDMNNKSSTKVNHGWIFKPNSQDNLEKISSPKKFASKIPETIMDEHERERVNNQLNFIKQIKKRDIQNSSIAMLGVQTGERIIIGHEKSATQGDRRSEISAALAKKYDGKSREELMLIANGMENEALLQRQRVKELEDYLDNLLLRVMETHPKLLQNPYSRTTSAKSG